MLGLVVIAALGRQERADGMAGVGGWVGASGPPTLDVFEPDLGGGGGSCNIVPNGSFSRGLAGWTMTPQTAHTTGAAAGSAVDVVSGRPLIIPMDDAVARLVAFALADGRSLDSESSASADSTLTFSSLVVVSNRFLQVTLGGGWEIVFFGAAGYTLDAHLEVHGPAGQIVWHSLDHLADAVAHDCESGFSILGLFSLARPQISVDVLGSSSRPTGIQVGDEVEFRIVLRCAALADQPCEYAEAVVVAYIDDVQFCATVSSPADLDDDGVVGGQDLAILLGAWGPCKPLAVAGFGPWCPADLDGNSVVNGLDLGLLLGAWG